MYDLHKELNRFFEKHVRLGRDRRIELAEFRDNSLIRLQRGLDKLGERNRRTYAYPSETRNQGGYAMHTLNQASGNDYDIDVALIFERDDLPDSPSRARERVRDAFIETGDLFRDPPSARQNAVTVWYATGQHLDFAVYRRYMTAYGVQVIEHAGGDAWTERDPDRVTSWFSDHVDNQSPRRELGATVDSGQLRKIVRLMKFFNRSRSAWRLPGGMITTALVAECYVANAARDDLALFHTLRALSLRLSFNLDVWSPIDSSNLTASQKRRTEMENLRDRLREILPKLDILNDRNCTREQARNAWRQFFNHDSWNAENDQGPSSRLLRAASVAPVASVTPAAAFTFPDQPRVPSKPQGFA
jgi:hypothetical protein